MTHQDGRRFVREALPLVRESGPNTLLLAPMPGFYRALPPMGARVVRGATVAEVEVLGRMVRLVAPDGSEGLVIAHPEGPRRARVPLAYGEVLLVVDPNAGAPAEVAEKRGSSSIAGSGLVFKTPLGGRYYARPGPGKEPFIQVGDEIKTGTTLAIVEVMKTFNRVQLGGLGMPDRARVLRIVPKDGDDLSAGDVLLELEAI